MKRHLLFLLSFCLFPFFGSAQTYLSQNFTTGGPGNPPASNPAGWTQSVISGNAAYDNWIYDNPFGRTLNAPISGQAAIFDSDAFSNDGLAENVALISPAFSAPAATTVLLEWDQFLEASFGGNGFVEVFDGTMWVQVWTAGGLSTSDPDFQSIDISALVAGVPTAQVRFRWTGDWSFFWIVDNVKVFTPLADDVGVTAIASPSTACGLSATEPVEVTVKNFGTAAVMGIPVSFRVDGGSVFTETIAGTLASGQDTNFLFVSNFADVSAIGPHTIEAFTSLSGDGDLLNDTTAKIITNSPTLSGFPYAESFESGPGFWTAAGANSSWALGTPAKTVITGASDGTNAWTTGGLSTGFYNNNEQSYIQSPCFDFSALTNPQVELDIWWHSEGGFDGAKLQTTVDSGATWQDVGTVGDPDNWFNNSSVDGLAFTGSLNGWSGLAGASSGGWVGAKHDLTGLAGEPSVRLRIAFGSDGSVVDDGFAFDNVRIGDPPPDDVSLNAILSPGSGCNLGASETVTVRVRNLGSAPASMIPVGFRVDGGSVTTEIIGGSLAPASDTNYVFTTNFADVSAPGPHTIEAFVSYPGDINITNDSLSAGLSNISGGDVLPIADNFNSYTAGATSFTSLFNDPAADIPWQANAGSTSSTDTGPNDDVTGGGNYIYMETSSPATPGDRAILRTNCLDLTSLTSPMLSFYYHMYGDAIGYLRVDVESGGTLTTEWLQTGQVQTANGDPFLQATIDLSAYAGQFVRIFWTGEIGTTGSSFNSDIALDNIVIEEPSPIDLGIIGFVLPATSGCYDATETIRVLVKNFGSMPVNFGTNNGTITADITGASMQTFSKTVTAGTINPGDTVPVTITTMADLSNGGTHNIKVYPTLSGDTNPINDTLTTGRTTVTPLTFPLAAVPFTGFNGSNLSTISPGWREAAGFPLPVGTTSGWTSDDFGNVSGGPNGTAAKINHFSIGNQEWILSPKFTATFESVICYDLALTGFASLADTTLGSDDSVNVMVSTDCGLSFSMLNSYNAASAIPAAGRTDTLSLIAYAGQDIIIGFYATEGTVDDPNDVDFFLDNIAIKQIFESDVELTAILSPVSGCLGSMETITVNVRNNGTLDAVDIPVGFRVDGGSVTTETIFGTFPSGADTNFVFAGSGDLSAPGMHTVEAFTSLSGDQFIPNDTNSVQVTNNLILAPFLENFESFTVGSPGTLANGWINGGGNYPWTVDSAGTSSGGTGPARDHTLGTSGGTYLYTEASSPVVTGDSFMVVSPCIDLSALSCPTLRFWYHMYGASMGSLHVDVNDGSGWMNDVIPPISGQQQTSDTADWKSAIANLSSFIGNTIQIRFRGIAGPDFESDMAIDDVEIFDLTTDVALTAILSPNTGCSLSSAEQLSVTVMSNGCTSIPSGTVSLTYYVSGPIATGPVTETLNVALPAGGSVNYTFTGTADLSAPGTYFVEAYQVLAGDIFQGNDTARSTLINSPVAGTFPYYEDFETGPGGWTAYGTNSSWQLGAPSNTFIDSACSGTQAWVTNLSGDYNNEELSYLESPCFDFSGLTQDPSLLFCFTIKTESCCDEGWVDYSTDGGQNWSKLGAVGTGDNWYNDPVNDWWDGIGPGSGTGSWLLSAHPLTGLAGQSDVKVRFAFSSDGSVAEEGMGIDSIFVGYPYPPVCGHDGFEPNNMQSAAGNLYGGVLGGGLDMGICPSGDIDWFYYQVSIAGNLTVSLKDQPVDLDFALFDSGGSMITSSMNGSTADEVLTIPVLPGDYYIKVEGNAGASSFDNYRLIASTTAPHGQVGTPIKPNINMPIWRGDAEASLSVYPNPTRDLVNVQFVATEGGIIRIELVDLVGKTVMSREMEGSQGLNLEQLDLRSLSAGTYFIKASSGKLSFTRKLIFSGE